MTEALVAVARRTPVLLYVVSSKSTPLVFDGIVLSTYAAQLGLSGGDSPPLESLLEPLQATAHPSKKVPSIVFSAIRPCMSFCDNHPHSQFLWLTVMFHVTTLARDLYDKISGGLPPLSYVFSRLIPSPRLCSAPSHRTSGCDSFDVLLVHSPLNPYPRARTSRLPGSPY